MPEAAARHAALDAPGLPSFAGRPTLFEDLGFTYCGPFDGHDVDEIRTALEKAKAHRGGPVLIHAVTVKGKGYAPAEAAADCYHGVAKFDAATGKQHKATPKAPSYTSVFAESLIQEADDDARIVAITAAMPSGTGLDKFGAAHPERCYDAGIAEQHAVTFCAGLACEGDFRCASPSTAPAWWAPTG
eukprot:g16250.t1